MIAWFHCFAGVAGDMALGALVDAGADLDEIRGLLQRIPMRGWRVEARPVLRAGLAATYVMVHADETAVVRTHAHIVGLIEEARLPERVRSRALAVFAALADVEGRLHRREPAQVHFHEVGGIDAVVDVVGVCSALEVLDVDEVRCSAVATGTGMVRAAHGLLPNPAPAVVELLRGAPTYGRDIAVELTTPTGAALVAGLSAGFGPMPPLMIDRVGYGAGTRELDGLPNCTQVVLGQALVERPPGQPIVLIETNVDDATGETLADAVAALLDAGAVDAWITPIVMKKGRPAYTVSALCDPTLVAQVSRTMTAETGSFGTRGTTLERWPSTRTIERVDVDGLAVRVKVSPGRAKVEHDDAVRVSRLRGLPVAEVVSRAEQAWRDRMAAARSGSDGDSDPPPAPEGDSA